MESAAMRREIGSLPAWILSKIPKGFENFYPKNLPKGLGKPGTAPKAGEKAGKALPKNKPAGKSSGPGAAEESPGDRLRNAFASAKKGGGGKKGPEGETPSGMPAPGSAAALAVLAFLVSRSFVTDVESTREVTWADFRNGMLEAGNVERIVVMNRTTARIMLRPGAEPFSAKGKRGDGSDSDHEFTDGAWGDDTKMDLGTGASVDSDAYPAPQGGKEHQRMYHFAIGSVESFERKLDLAQREMGRHPRDFVPVQYVQETNWGAEIMRNLPAIILVGVLVAAMRGMGGMPGGGGGGPGGIFKIGKSNAKKIKKEEINISFKDVAGCQEAKKEIMEFVDFLRDASKFTKLGAKIPKGALLCGPPGTGKTLLAKAVAGEASVPFFSISGSDFIEMFVGVGPSRVRDLFKEARAAAPCIIFIDEIDAVGRQRGKGGFSGGNDERENTLNQLLVEMDGFSPSTGVVVLAGTNRADILDSALTRAGRFDRQITVDKPDIQGRKEIFGVHLKGILLAGSSEEYSGRLAGLTPGFVGADIANICNEAAIQAARRAGESVEMMDFEKAVDRVIGGLESNKLISKEEQNIVAHHEAGHAVAGWFLEHADPLLKVTIIPRSSGALGFAQYLPKEISLRTEEQIMDIVCMALAGRAAEEVFFGNVTTGASDDLRRVTEMVYQTIQLYGMNDKVGQLAFPTDPNALNKPYSDQTAQLMDDEARRVVEEAYARTIALITERKEEVMKVTNLLLEKETINHDDIIDLIGARPFKADKNYADYVSSRGLREGAKKEKPVEEVEEEEPVEEPNVPVGPALAFKGY